ncbi:MAG: diaminopimelate epimerase [Myxococcales bacterium]|nr:diaminopimelate epimerase [Myxococcales bacterium]|tara:strand:- start:156 stop:1040 length:885 start_codon:yes stop_codon:yes gene_type:complete
MRLPFKKYEGLKNDFIIIDLRNVDQEGLQMQWGNQNLHMALCDRHGGIGADGVLFLEDDNDAVARMKITNSDGSTPEMCGNGIRCVAQYMVDSDEIIGGGPFVIQSDAGPKTIQIQGSGIKVAMGQGKPQTSPAAETPWGGNSAWQPSNWEGPAPLAWAVDMGNPHLVLDFPVSAQEMLKWGPVWAAHPYFEAGVNVGFSRVLASNEIELKVWERGAGATMACGTGACAAALAWWQHRDWRGPVKVNLPGGQLEIGLQRASEGGFDVVMTGPAQHVYSGEVPESWWSTVIDAAK